MNDILSIQNLTKHYGKSRGVSNITFDVKEGDIFGFLGPNGAGKSTTIRSILGLIHYQEGEVLILGKNAKSNHTDLLKDIGYMPSEALFYPNMKVKDVIKLAANIRHMNCDAEAKMLCKRLQVPIDKKISELSLGNRKKVSIVCAMQHRPKLFIFDEPTSGLDPLMQATFFSLIEEYVKEGATCLLSTHVLSEVKNHCNRVAIMKEGKLLCVDTVKHLTKGSAKRIKMIRDGEILDYLYKGNLNDIYKEFEGHEISDLLIEEPSIDEIFMHYYGGENKL